VLIIRAAQIRVLGREPFTPAETRRRTAANLEFLAAALHHLTD